MGRARRSVVAPIFRSDAQGRILAAILLAPESVHLRAIAHRADVPFSTVQREVDRLEESGIVHSERFAQARVVRPDDTSPLIDELRSLVLKSYGPVHVLAESLSVVPRIDEAFVFGSWAARYKGEPGAMPHDVDVLIVGDPPLDAVEDACATAADRLGVDVQPTIVSARRWARSDSPFLETVKARPLVPVPLYKL